MAGRGKPRSEWTPAYRRRIERAEALHPGISRAEARGKRGPAGLRDALKTGTGVTSYTSKRDTQGKVSETTFVVTGKDGLDRVFRVRRGESKEAKKDFTRQLKRTAKQIRDSGIEYQDYKQTKPPGTGGDTTYFDKVRAA